MRVKGLHHVAIICSDYERTKDFYVNKLGFEIVAEHYRRERNSYKLDLRVGEKIQIEIFSFSNAPLRVSYPEARGLRHLAFEVENMELAIKELENSGIECEKVRIDEYTGKKFTFFSDPDGLPLELYES
jgi:glyoxylase I family protein